MVDKKVTFTLAALTEDAKQRLEDIQVRLGLLTDRAHDIKIDANDAAARLKVDSFLGKLSALNAKEISPNISLSGYYKVLAQLDSLEIAAGRINRGDFRGGGALGTGAAGAASGGGGLGALGPYGIGAAIAAGTIAAPAAAGGLVTLGLGAIGIKEALATNTKAASEFTAALAKIDTAAGKAFQPVVNALAEMAKQLAGPVGKLFSDAEPGFLAFIKGLEPELAKVIPQLGQFVKSFAPFAGELGHTVGLALETIVRALQNLEPAFLASAHFIHGTTAVIGGLLDGLSRTFGDIMAIISDTFQGKWRDIGKRAQDILHYATDGLASLLEKFEVWALTTWIPRLLTGFVKGLLKLPDMMGTIGHNAIDAFLAGLQSVPVLGTVEKIAGGLIGGLKHMLGISSPSTVAAGLGRNFTQGFYIGLTQAGAGVGVNVNGVGGGGGRQPIVIQLQGGGSGLDLMFWQWLINGIRQRGGGSSNSVQIALGQRH